MISQRGSVLEVPLAQQITRGASLESLFVASSRGLAIIGSVVSAAQFVQRTSVSRVFRQIGSGASIVGCMLFRSRAPKILSGSSSSGTAEETIFTLFR